MTRRITLPLGESTTETHCGNCPVHVKTPWTCYRFNTYLTGWLNPNRLADCRAAEVKDEEVGDAGPVV